MRSTRKQSDEYRKLLDKHTALIESLKEVPKDCYWYQIKSEEARELNGKLLFMELMYGSYTNRKL